MTELNPPIDDIASKTNADVSQKHLIERILGCTAFVGSRLMDEASRLEYLANTDALTNVWNRRWFEEAAKCEIYRMQRHHHPVSIVLIDIDHFKTINDQHGHQIGDEVLVILADTICAVCREGDSLARLGGEEFAVLAANTGFTGARRLAERIATGLRVRSFPFGGPVTVSMGVTEYLSAEDYQSWIARTDRALYDAKESGRNRIVTDPTSDFSERLTTEQRSTGFLRLEWHDDYCSGHGLIDRQHRSLFSLSSLVLEAIVRKQPRDELRLLFERLLNNISQHFIDEEAVLKQFHYNDISTHASDHQRLLCLANDMKDAFANDKLKAGDLIEYIAVDVIAGHVIGADSKYFPCLVSNSAKAKGSLE